MQRGIHPDYQLTIFRDTASGDSRLMRTTKASHATAVWSDGQAYPVIDVEISSASHPFFTGQAKLRDTAGRIDKFRKKYKK